MSTTQSFIGFSIKLNEDQQTIDQLHSLSKHELGFDFVKSDEIGENDLHKFKDKKDQWVPAEDTNGKFGFIYLIESERDVNYMECYTSLNYMTLILSQLVAEIRSCCEPHSYGVFNIIWYNGVDNPFNF